MTTAGQIIKGKQDYNDKTGHGQQGLLSAHCLFPLHGCPASKRSGPNGVHLLSFKMDDLGKGETALPEKRHWFDFHENTEYDETVMVFEAVWDSEDIPTMDWSCQTPRECHSLEGGQFQVSNLR